MKYIHLHKNVQHTDITKRLCAQHSVKTEHYQDHWHPAGAPTPAGSHCPLRWSLLCFFFYLNTYICILEHCSLVFTCVSLLCKKISMVLDFSRWYAILNLHKLLCLVSFTQHYVCKVYTFYIVHNLLIYIAML